MNEKRVVRWVGWGGRERERERGLLKKMLICMVKDGCIDEDSEESWADL